jgi:putative redox protein
MIAEVKAIINKDHYQTRIEAGVHAVISDEPVKGGGSNMGFSPFELLASSLAACTCMTLRMYIDKKNWDIDKIEVSVSIEKDEVHDETHFKRKIRIEADITHEQKGKLMDIANKCPVHQTLSKSVYINTEAV